MKTNVIELEQIINAISKKYIENKYPNFIEKGLFDEQTNIEKTENYTVQKDSSNYTVKLRTNLSRELHMADSLPSGIKGHLFKLEAIEPFLISLDIPCPEIFKLSNQQNNKHISPPITAKPKKVSIKINLIKRTVIVKFDGVINDSYKSLKDVCGKTKSIEILLTMFANDTIVPVEGFKRKYMAANGNSPDVANHLQKANKKLKTLFGLSQNRPIRQSSGAMVCDFSVSLVKKQDASESSTSEYEDEKHAYENNQGFKNFYIHEDDSTEDDF